MMSPELSIIILFGSIAVVVFWILAFSFLLQVGSRHKELLDAIRSIGQRQDPATPCVWKITGIAADGIKSASTVRASTREEAIAIAGKHWAQVNSAERV